MPPPQVRLVLAARPADTAKSGRLFSTVELIITATFMTMNSPAPELSGVTQTGAMIRLADFRGQSAVVVFFYPKDNTAICTKEACAFRDAYEDFVQAGATVIGVSSDSVAKHQAFANGHALPFLLVADTDGTWRKAFGVPKTLGIFPGRVTYVIDRAGVIRHIFNAQFAAGRHVEEALQIVKQL